MLLADFMRTHGISDAVMAAAIGGIKPEFVRKLRFRAKGCSLATAARIERATGGKVKSFDLLPLKPRAAPAPAGARS